jgi:hypothetical protein
MPALRMLPQHAIPPVKYFPPEKSQEEVVDMPETEKRRFTRHDSLFLLDYIVLDKEGNKGVYSMGRTLDVCVDGIKLEVLTPLEIGTLLIITVGFENELIELVGEVTHTEYRGGRYDSGVAFYKISKKGRTIFAKYSEAFLQRKKELEESGGTIDPR